MWAWDKLALLQKVLQSTPPETAPWILYVEPNAVSSEMALTFPFEVYTGKHWISTGDMQDLMGGSTSKSCKCACPIVTSLSEKSI